MVKLTVNVKVGEGTMRYIRLKSGLQHDQVLNRLFYNPEIIELHLEEQHLYQPDLIVRTIQFLKAKGVRVYLHHPTTFQGKHLDIVSPFQQMSNHYDWSCKLLASICRMEDVNCVIHCHYKALDTHDYLNAANRALMRGRIEEILHICDKSFLWEDTTAGIFSAQNPYLLDEIVGPLQLPLTIDLSHSFISLNGDNKRLKEHLDAFHQYANYFHVVDSSGRRHDSLPLGAGKIDWKMVKPYLKDRDFIFEIDLRASNYIDCSPMIESAVYFEKI
jgi:sugar phosphate isomerase/epimerase